MRVEIPHAVQASRPGEVESLFTRPVELINAAKLELMGVTLTGSRMRDGYPPVQEPLRRTRLLEGWSDGYLSGSLKFLSGVGVTVERSRMIEGL